MGFLILERLADIEIWKTNQDGRKEKKKLFKECALEMIHILKTGKFEKNAFSFCR